MSRTTPKLGCAERIVLARVKEVWIGIEDPDPTVDRKGIQRLEERGIKIHMFDLDLQEVILKENDDYIRQAKARAGEVKAKEKPIALSELENKVSTARMEDLSRTALEKYIAAAKLDTQPDSEAFRQRLRQLDFRQVNQVTMFQQEMEFCYLQKNPGGLCRRQVCWQKSNLLMARQKQWIFQDPWF